MSMSLLELLALGDQLPQGWRDLVDQSADQLADGRLLLFRWVEFARHLPPELSTHFWLPKQWWEGRQQLEVATWPDSAQTAVISADQLPYFRLYLELDGVRQPRPLQWSHTGPLPDDQRRVG